MAPEPEARPRADFYDHESEAPRRRRRPAADWGVAEDIFDRMPSRRFSRADRRAVHHEIVIRHNDDVSPERRDEWADEPVRGRAAAPRRDAASWGDDDAWAADEPTTRERAAAPRRDAASWGDDDAWADERPAEPVRGPAAAAADEEPDFAGHLMAAPAQPSVDSWMDDDERRLVPGESRTIVLGADGAPEEPRPRRTVKISGHPDRLPVPRTQRPPRTAVERIGASPDRIVAYAVALGFLLVLIAVLTTGQ